MKNKLIVILMMVTLLLCGVVLGRMMRPSFGAPPVETPYQPPFPSLGEGW